MVSGTRYDRINAIGSRQRGRISRRQLLAAMLTPAEMRTMVEHGYLRRRGHGVYAIGHEAPTPLAAETEALLAVGGDAALSYASAAALWGACPPAPRGPVHVSSARGIRVRNIVAHRSRLLIPDDIRTREGLPVTSPAWTVLDLAGMTGVGNRRLEWAIDHLLVNRLMRRTELEQMVVRMTGRRAGVDRVRTLLTGDSSPALTRSDAEELFLAIVRGAGLPVPRVNVRRDGWEIDFLWPEAAVAVEVDGFGFHSSRARFERDRAKDAALRALGFVVARFSRRQVRDEPLLVAAQLGQLLAGAA